MKRKISFLLALGILLTTAFSCGETDSSTETTAQSGSTSAAETTESVESLLGFPAEDNGGTTFTMLINTTKSFEYVADEITGDVVNDAVYENRRQSRITSAFRSNSCRRTATGTLAIHSIT